MELENSASIDGGNSLHESAPIESRISKFFMTLMEHPEAAECGDPIDRLKIVRSGVPLGTVQDWVKTGVVNENILNEIVISQRSQDDRISNNINHLTPHESDVAVRIARFMAYCLSVFENADLAIRFANSPNPVLSGQIPLKLMDTQAGYEYVVHKMEAGEFKD